MALTPARIPPGTRVTGSAGQATRRQQDGPEGTPDTNAQNGLPLEAAPAGPSPHWFSSRRNRVQAGGTAWNGLPSALSAKADAFLAPADVAAAGQVSSGWRTGAALATRQMLRQHYFGTAHPAQGLTPEKHAATDPKGYLESVPLDELNRPGPRSVMVREGVWHMEVAANRLLPGHKQEPPREPSVSPGQLRALFGETHPYGSLAFGGDQLALIQGLERGLHGKGRIFMDEESRQRIAKGHVNYLVPMDDLQVVHLNGGEVLALHGHRHATPDGTHDAILQTLRPALPDIVGPIREVTVLNGIHNFRILALGTGGRLLVGSVSKPHAAECAGVALTRSEWPWGDARVSRLFPGRSLAQLEDGRVFFMEVWDRRGAPARIEARQLQLPEGVDISFAPEFSELLLLSDGTVRRVPSENRAEGPLPLADVWGSGAEALNNPDMRFHYLQKYPGGTHIAIGQSRIHEKEWTLLVNRQPVSVPEPWSPKDIVGVHWMKPGLVFDLGNGDLFCWGGPFGEEGHMRKSSDLKEIEHPYLAGRPTAMVHANPARAIAQRSSRVHAASAHEAGAGPARRGLTRAVVGALKKSANWKYSTKELKAARCVSLKGLGSDHDRECRKANLHVWSAARKERRDVDGVPTSFLVCESEKFLPALRDYVAQKPRHAAAKFTYEIPKNLLQPAD